MCHASDMDTVFIKSEHDLALFDKETAADDAKALDPAAVLTELSPPQPPRHKSKQQQQQQQHQTAQRRMRRPFSVSEVEALVQAVEKLGTGRYN